MTDVTPPEALPFSFGAMAQPAPQNFGALVWVHPDREQFPDPFVVFAAMTVIGDLNFWLTPEGAVEIANMLLSTAAQANARRGPRLVVPPPNVDLEKLNGNLRGESRR